MRFQHDAVSALKKARQQYLQRCDELEKAKAVSAKAVDDTAGIKTLDKRRKSKDEAQTRVTVIIMCQINIICIMLFSANGPCVLCCCETIRSCDCVAALRLSLCPVQVMEAELMYRQCVTDAKIHQDELVKVKERIISHIRKLICQGDTVLKEVSMKLHVYTYVCYILIHSWYVVVVVVRHAVAL